MANFAKFVAIYDIQVVGLIDVDWMAERSGNTDQALQLCHQMPGGCEGLETLYFTLPNATGSYGIAAVSNVPMGVSTSELFNSTCYPGAVSGNGHGILATPVTISNYTFHIITVHAPGVSTGSQFPRCRTL